MVGVKKMVAIKEKLLENDSRFCITHLTQKKQLIVPYITYVTVKILKLQFIAFAPCYVEFCVIVVVIF